MSVERRSNGILPESQRMVVSYSRLLETIQSALTANGFATEVALPIAKTMAACERDGTPSHGLLRLSGFIEAVRSGWADGRVLPEVVSRSPSMIVVDARSGFTHLALERSRDELARMAAETGVAVLLIRSAHHSAALWPDIEAFARDGYIALTCVNSRPRVLAWGGGKPVFGTNAAAFACPRADGAPIVWDQATSVMSQGDILLAARDGRKLPPGVGVDAAGQPTLDPQAVLDGGALAPYGNNKGASIAFTVEVLAAALTGSDFGFESPAKGTLPSKCGQFLMLIDPRRSGADVAVRVESLVRAVNEAGASRMPASRRYARRAQADTEGISVDARAYSELLGMATSRV